MKIDDLISGKLYKIIAASNHGYGGYPIFSKYEYPKERKDVKFFATQENSIEGVYANQIICEGLYPENIFMFIEILSETFVMYGKRFRWVHILLHNKYVWIMVEKESPLNNFIQVGI